MLPCPLLSPGVCSCPLSWWCHPTISSSVIPFFSCFQSFPVSGSFPRSQFFPSGGQGIGAVGSASVLPMNIQDLFPLELTALISLLSKGLSRVSSNTTVLKHFGTRLIYGPTLTSIRDYWKNHSSDQTDFVGKVISLLFNMLSNFVIAFLPRMKRLLIPWQQSLFATVQEKKICHCFHFFPFYLPWSDMTECYDLSFLNVRF